MKVRSKKTGSNNDDWETPEYIYAYLREYVFPSKCNGFFDPCPLKSTFDGLNIEWQDYNYINPPYNRKGKEAFIRKAFEESKKGKFCVMLIPANVETDIFHTVIVPNAEVYLIRKRVKFKGTNSEGKYVTGKTGQSGHMFVIFGSGKSPKIDVCNIIIKKEVEARCDVANDGIPSKTKVLGILPNEL